MKTSVLKFCRTALLLALVLSGCPDLMGPATVAVSKVTVDQNGRKQTALSATAQTERHNPNAQRFAVGKTSPIGF